MKKILLVDDDDYFRTGIKAILSKSYEVVEAPNGKVAKEILSFARFDLILSDIRLPYISGLELLKWVKIYAPTPMILMTGFSVIIETQKAHEAGAEEFLPKPFGCKELLEKVERVFASVSENAVDLDAEFCRMPVEHFVGDEEKAYGVYIRISSSKYIKIAYKSGKLPEEKIKDFLQKGVTHLYVRQKDCSC